LVVTVPLLPIDVLEVAVPTGVPPFRSSIFTVDPRLILKEFDPNDGAKLSKKSLKKD